MTRADQPSKLSMTVWLLCLISSTFFQAERGKWRDGTLDQAPWGEVSESLSEGIHDRGEHNDSDNIWWL